LIVRGVVPGRHHVAETQERHDHFGEFQKVLSKHLQHHQAKSPVCCSQ
jgi:hypothetical protein